MPRWTPKSILFPSGVVRIDSRLRPTPLYVRALRCNHYWDFSWRRQAASSTEFFPVGKRIFVLERGPFLPGEKDNRSYHGSLKYYSSEVMFNKGGEKSGRLQPIKYRDWEPYYAEAEELYQVRVIECRGPSQVSESKAPDLHRNCF